LFIYCLGWFSGNLFRNGGRGINIIKGDVIRFN